MTYSDYKISLDINDHSSRVSLKAKRGDTGRILYITLKDGGKPYIITSECRAVFTAKKADGNILYNDCSVVGNTIAYAFTPQTTSSVGKADCEIKLYGADDKLLTSARFALVVEDAVYNEGDEVESETEVSALTKLVSEASSLINTVETKLANGDFVGKPGPVGPAGADGTVSFDELTEEQRESLCGPIVSGEGAYSAQGGIGNEVISEAGFTHGKGNFVGLKGYYYSNIDFEAKTITLSTKQLAADGDGIQLTWEVGDKVTIVNDSHYDRCSTITAINGNVITVDSLPFAAVVNVSDPDWDDYGICVVDKPDAGVVDLGKYSTAIGESNTVAERTATAIGRENIVQGQYGVALGRGNIVKAYAGVALGRGNTIEPTALYAFTEGVLNTATGLAAHAGGSNSQATADGAYAHGYKCEATGKWSTAVNYMTIASGLYAHAGGYNTAAPGEGSTAFGIDTVAEGRASLASGLGVKAVRSNSAWFGQYNNPKDNHIFGIGLGISDTNRANAFAIDASGTSNFFGNRVAGIADAVADTDAVNLRQLNAGLAEKAPAGHVANYIECTSSEAVDNAIKDEWSKMADNSIRHIVLALNGGDRGLHSGNWHVTLNQTSYAYGTVTAINYYYNGMTAQRSIFDGSWGEWEWVNPPMVLGEEYRTTERWNGKAVYTQLVNFGACPLSSTKSLTVKIDKHSPSMMVDILGVLFDPGGIYVNIDNADGVSSEYTMLENEIIDWDNLDELGNPTRITSGSIMLTVTTTNDYYKHYGVYFTLKYTKD